MSAATSPNCLIRKQMFKIFQLFFIVQSSSQLFLPHFPRKQQKKDKQTLLTRLCLQLDVFAFPHRLSALALWSAQLGQIFCAKNVTTTDN